MDIKIGIPLRLGHLPLLMDFLRRSRVFDVIDHAIKEDPRSKVSTSECVAVILCSVYAGAHDLWRVRERMARYDMKTIMGDPLFDINEFTEERLAKAMDDLQRFNLDKLMTSVALQAIEQFHLRTDFFTFDTTSLSFYGAYENEEFGSITTDMPPAPPRVTFGHAKNHRSDLKQILYGTLMTADGGIPLMGKALDGNKSDNHAAAEFFGQVRKLVENPRNVCCVADSKGWCARVLRLAKDENLRILSRLPRTHKLHEQIMAKKWQPEGKLEIPARGKRDEPDVYEYMGFDVEESLRLDTTAATPNAPKTHELVDVSARAVRIFSTALLRTKLKSLERTRAREVKAATIQIGKWQNCGYACEIDAQRAAERQCLDHGWITRDLHPTLVPVVGPMKPRRGRPSSHAETPLLGDHYRITYTSSPVSKSVSERRLHRQSTFILIRTRNDGWKIEDSELIPRYKGLYHNEHGFAWLKSGASLNPVFLHTEERIASLCFIYCIGLMAWSLIQREVRKTLKATNTMLPYHRGKPSNMITTRFLFELFAQVQVVPYRMGDGPEKRELAGFEGTVEAACRAAGTKRKAFTPC